MATKEMTMTKQFPIEVVLSLTTGTLLAEKFGAVHEMIEWVAGHSVWTHEMADAGAMDRYAGRVLDAHPELRDFDVTDVTDPETARSAVAKARRSFGQTVEIDQGSDKRTESPTKTAQRIIAGKEATS